MTCLVALVSMAALGAAAGPDTTGRIIGHWRTDDGSAIIAIDGCGERICGAIFRILDRNAPARDINNPVPALRRHPLVGTRILSGFQKNGSEWRNGRAYDPKTGRSYRSSLRLDGPDRLRVTGCVAFFCRTRSWRRVP